MKILNNRNWLTNKIIYFILESLLKITHTNTYFIVYLHDPSPTTYNLYTHIHTNNILKYTYAPTIIILMMQIPDEEISPEQEIENEIERVKKPSKKVGAKKADEKVSEKPDDEIENEAEPVKRPSKKLAAKKAEEKNEEEIQNEAEPVKRPSKKIKKKKSEELVTVEQPEDEIKKPVEETEEPKKVKKSVEEKRKSIIDGKKEEPESDVVNNVDAVNEEDLKPKKPTSRRSSKLKEESPEKIAPTIEVHKHKHEYFAYFFFSANKT